MPSRDVWSKGGNDTAQGLLASLIATLLLSDRSRAPMYLCSPYLSDFVLFDNSFGQFTAILSDLPELADKRALRLSDVLRCLARHMPVRIVTIRHPSSSAFLDRLTGSSEDDISIRLAGDALHEKGLLCEDFYIEGSMNFTHSGVYVRDEKVTSHIAEDVIGRQKIAAAYLEFERLWTRLGSTARPRASQ